MAKYRSTSSPITPTSGTPLDLYQSPAAQGLIFYPALHQPNFYDHFTRSPCTLVGSGVVIKDTIRGRAAYTPSTSTTGLSWPFPAALASVGTQHTVAGWWRIEAAAASACLFSLPWTSGGFVAPYSTMLLQRNASTANLAYGYTSSSGTEILSASFAPNTFLIDSQWHHIAVVRLDSAVRFYLDGIQTLATTVSANNPPDWSGHQQPLTLNNYSSTAPSVGVQGSVWGVGLWNRALGAPQIEQLAYEPTLLYAQPDINFRSNPALLPTFNYSRRRTVPKLTTVLQPTAGQTIDRAHPLAQGLLFYPDMNDGSFNDPISRNNGTVVGAPNAAIKQTAHGNVLVTTGAAAGVSWPKPTGVGSLGSNYSVAAWVLLTTMPNGDIIFCLPSSTTWTAPFYILAWGSTASGFPTLAYSDSGGTNVAPTISTSGYLNVDGKWHFMAATRSGATFTYYCDGLAPLPVTDGTNHAPNWGPTTQPICALVATSTAPQGGAAGAMHSLGLWNRTLSTAEIRQLYYTPNVLYWEPKTRYFSNDTSLLTGRGTATITFPFPANLMTWTPSGPNQVVAWSGAEGNLALGCVALDANGTTSAEYIEWTGTWADLGVPAGSTVTSIKLTSLANKFPITNGLPLQAGPVELRNSGGTLQATLWPGRIPISSDSAWVITPSQPGAAVPAGVAATATTIKLRIGTSLAWVTLNPSSTLRIDDVGLAIDYVSAPAGVFQPAWAARANTFFGIG